MTPTEFRACWDRFKDAVHPGDVLAGVVWRGNATRWLIDIGAPFLANLDRIDADDSEPLEVGTTVEIFVKHQSDRMMMPFVSSRPELLTRARRRIDLPADLRGEIVWPPPVEEPQSE
ncbi:MAG: hypothetical protein ACRD2W_06035 [Acidimicrobiales bacterium]